MSEAIITVENLSKKYVLGSGNRSEGLRHAIQDWATAPMRWLRNKGQPTSVLRPPTSGPEEFWALKDVSFEIKRGDVVGIIGRNGAGKSTLLKILSRITEPTSGRVTLRGRVASLLEVGTGFHPELSGRENVFLNGAILGMSRAEIKRKFDEIVAFAEVEKFLDTPVKRYSSGMYVRLAFAVAAHLEPEILIVDEVLAVGDAEFQKKCLGKMQEVSKGGRTVIFVSHNMDAVRLLTSTCLFLNRGENAFYGSTSSTLAKYLRGNGTETVEYRDDLLGNNPKITRVSLRTSEPDGIQGSGQRMDIFFTAYLPETPKEICLSCYMCDETDLRVGYVYNFTEGSMVNLKDKHLKITCSISKLRLYKGRYYLKVFFAERQGGRIFSAIEFACPFDVVMTSYRNEWGWESGECKYIEDSSWQSSD